MITWHERVVLEIARRKSVVFLGAGVSRQSATPQGAYPPLWREFLDQALLKCNGSVAEIKRHLKANDFLTACQLIRSRLGEHDWHDLLEHTFCHPNFQGAEIYQHVFDLDLPIIATTNIDSIYDRFFAAKYAGAAIAKSYYDESLGRHIKGDASTRLVLKVHGSADDPANAIFTREQYADARNKYVFFYDAMSALITTQTFVFLGYGLTDPDIQLLLENNARLFRSPTPHFLITADRPSADMVGMFERNYSIKVLRYSDKNNHAELTESLADLVARVTVARTQLAASLIW